mmetsp:Transcript_1125/g.2427  ORF Transcript_1125/g.2427 Transcript_1125/m.2427 type:complete len:359 (-) Transcript_1125:744-1820(-)
MDPDKLVQVLLACPQLHRQREPLDDLSCVVAHDVHANYPLLLGGKDDHLKEACCSLARSSRLQLHHGQRPLERSVEVVVDFDLILAILVHRLLLAHADTPVLEGREDCRGDPEIIHLPPRVAKQTISKKLARLDGDGSELRTAVQNIPDGKDMLAGCLLRVSDALANSHDLLRLALDLHSRLVEIQLLRQSIPSDGKQDGIEHVFFHLALVIRVVDFHLLANLLKLLRQTTSPYVDPVLLHVVHNQLRTLLVETTERNGPHHHSGRKAYGMQEPCALESYIGGSDNQGSARRLLEGEQVVAGHTALSISLDVQILGSPSHGDHKGGGCLAFHSPKRVLELNSVRVEEASFAVPILDVC